MSVHPIEEESYRILERRVDLSSLGHGAAALAARVVHATADPALASALVADERAVQAGIGALATGAPVLCDVEMVRAGISAVPVFCALAGASEGEGSSGGTADTRTYPSRTAAAMASLASRHPEGAIVVVGCAPTALAEVNRLIDGGELRPALVVGVPVGFVGAEESKERLLETSARSGVPAIALRGERGGAAVAAAIVNALVRLADGAHGHATPPGCLFIGHGTRSSAGAEELREFVSAAGAARPGVRVAAGFIEFVEPGLDEAIDSMVAGGTTSIVAVPLVLFGAGHLKDDGPAALARARARHPGVSYAYARELGVHPDVLAVVGDRARQCASLLPEGRADAVVVVGRGSTDPDANADLSKAARLLADGRDLTEPVVAPQPGAPALGIVLPAFVSLASPGVADALDQCAALGATRIAVVPYFLFDGLLLERIRTQAAAWAARHPDHVVVTGAQMGIDPRIVSLAWQRHDEARGGMAHMNCDGCLYRTPLPGYAHRVGTRPAV